MYGGKILHSDPCRACVGHGLGLMSIEVIVGREIYFFLNAVYTLLLILANSRDGWLESALEVSHIMRRIICDTSNALSCAI